MLRCQSEAESPNSTSRGHSAGRVHHTAMGKANTSVLKAGTADAEAIALVHISSWQEAYRGLLPDRILSGLDVTDRADRWRKILRTKAEKTDGLVAIAAQGSKVVGFVSVGPQRDEKLLCLSPCFWATDLSFL